ncbi:MAG TPA: response regulator transcription factor [Phaeodactylibacter sp.]|nr:response regulator transcription factor [Phaeodactylibacter sp.]
MRVLCVDDEYLALQLLKEFISQVPDLEPVGFLKSPIEALKVLQEQTVDLLFLDIQMPTLAGNNLLKALPHPPQTVFTTAYADYATEAFDLDAVDYLLKPFSFERFLKAVNKARNAMASKAPSGIGAQQLLEGTKDYMAVKADGKMRKIWFREIRYVEGLKEYVRIHCEEGKYVVLERMKTLEEILPKGHFMRVHKSYIIACNRVTGLEGNMLELGADRIPVSRAKREEVVKLLF